MGAMLNLLAIFLLAVISVILFLEWRNERRLRLSLQEDNNLKDLVLSASLGGYYFFDNIEDKEYFSDNLVKMLKLSPEVVTFEQLLKLFFSDRQAIKLAVDSLKKAQQDRFMLNAKVKVAGQTRYVHCIGHRIDNSLGKVTGIVIWLLDTTDYAHRLKHTIKENHHIKNQLKTYLSIINALPFPIWQRNRENFEISYNNLAYAKIVGDKNNKIGEVSTISELYKGMKEAGLDSYKKGRNFSTKRHLIIDGDRRLYDILEKPLEENNSILGIGYDITDSENLTHELNRHISAHADLLESSSSAMAIYGRDTKLKFYNNAFVRMGEFEEQWLSSNPNYNEVLEYLREKRLLPEQADFRSFREEQLKLFNDLLEPHEEFFYLPSGKTLRVIVIPHALGGLLFAYEDVTNRLEMERSYNTLIAVQKVTLDHVNEGVTVYGGNGLLKLYNPKYAALWPDEIPYLVQGVHLSELLEISKSLYSYGNDWNKFKENIISDLASRSPVIRYLERTDGKVINRISIPLPDGDTLISYVDVTDSVLLERSLRERNDALEEADKLKTEFLANVSYEFRTPLTSIMGFTELLKQNLVGELSDRQKEYINNIYDSSVQLNSLINDVLDLATIEAGYMTLDPSKFNLCNLITGVIEILKERINQQNVTIELKFSDNNSIIVADERKIKQVIFNILSNAIKFTPYGGKIIVGFNKMGKNYIVWVQDNGSGIAKLEQNKVFDKFYTSSVAQMSGKSGTGLGLAVVKNIIELHGGSVILESAVDQGTLVKCIIPCNV